VNKRNTPVIATLVAAVLCGLPGLFGLCFGTATLLAGFMPGARIDVFGSTEQASAVTLSLLVLCMSIVMTAMPVIVWFVTRRRREPPPIDDEPLPPAS
jgi:hypothetical protein